MVDQKVLESEANKAGITADALIEQQVDSKIPEPSDGEVEAFYLAQKDRLNRPLDEIRIQLRATLKAIEGPASSTRLYKGVAASS
jgi:hypothetical protein